MATAEEANEFLGGLAAYVDDELSKASMGKYGFSLVFWKKGEPESAGGIAIMTPPDCQLDQRAALLRASSLSKHPIVKIDMHGLDTKDRVCFYEQDYYVLSNFSAFPIHWRHLCFPTVEHAYHWEKFADGGCPAGAGVIEYKLRQQDLSAHDAFKLAQENKHLRRSDWEEVKVGIMQALLRAKVEQHEYVRRKLLATGYRELVENSWRDDFWGWGPKRDGKNVLGRLWMAVRAELRGEPVTALEV